MKLGINGSGFFENIDSSTETLIKSFNELCIRVPGGAISRFHEPFTNRNGWGLTAENVNYFFDNYNVGADEDDPNGGRDKWLQKVQEQPNYSYLDKLIELSAQMPGLTVIYVINVFTSTMEEQMNALSYLINGGVRIVAVEFGNEVYGKYEFNTEDYISFCAPIISAIKSQYPSVKVSLISGNFKGRRDHEQWNSMLAEYVNNPANQVDYVTLHFYIGSDLAPLAYSLLPAPKVVDYSVPDEELMSACDAYVAEVLDVDRLQEEVNMAKDLYNVPIIITEWNNNPAASWCNTMVNAQWIYKELLLLEGVDYLCLHNGVSPDIYGAICRKKAQDDTTLEMVPRLSYYALKLADDYKKKITEGYTPLSEKQDGTVIFSSPGKYIIPVIADNMGFYLSFTPAAGLSVTSLELTHVDAIYPYSSAGATGFQSKRQAPNMEVTGITVITLYPATTGYEVPNNCFGYITAEVVAEATGPTADAGPDKTYKTTDIANVILDASASVPGSAPIKNYVWSVLQVDGSVVGALEGIEPRTSIALAPGNYYATLTVIDENEKISSDTTFITVKRKKRGFFSNLIRLNDKSNKISQTKDNIQA